MTSAVNDQLYCLNCKERTHTLEAQEVVLKNVRPAVTGRASPVGPRSSAWARLGSDRWGVKTMVVRLDFQLYIWVLVSPYELVIIR